MSGMVFDLAIEVAEEIAAKRGLRTLRTPQGLFFLDEEGRKVHSRALVQAVRSRLQQRLAERARAEQMARWGKQDILTVRVLDADSGRVETLDGTAEGYIPPQERGRAKLTPGQTLPVKVLDAARGRLSFSFPGVLRHVLAREVPEIAAGEVGIARIAREAGVRSKVAVTARAPDLDPIGACIGPGACRIEAVRQALAGESVDIVPYSRIIEEFVASALAPAKVTEAKIKPGTCVALVTVQASQKSLAIGPGGLNVRLAAHLTGCKIDVQ